MKIEGMSATETEGRLSQLLCSALGGVAARAGYNEELASQAMDLAEVALRLYAERYADLLAAAEAEGGML